MKALQVARMIKKYGEASRAWYQNQHNEYFFNLANELDKRIEFILHVNDFPGLNERLWDMFLRACWSTTRLTPHI